MIECLLEVSDPVLVQACWSNIRLLSTFVFHFVTGAWMQ